MKKIKLKYYQIDIIESFKKMKSCEIALSVTSTKITDEDYNLGKHKLYVKYNGKKLTNSSIKK